MFGIFSEADKSHSHTCEEVIEAGNNHPRVGAQTFTRAGDRLPPARLGELSVHRRRLRVWGSRLGSGGSIGPAWGAAPDLPHRPGKEDPRDHPVFRRAKDIPQNAVQEYL